MQLAPQPRVEPGRARSTPYRAAPAWHPIRLPEASCFRERRPWRTITVRLAVPKSPAPRAGLPWVALGTFPGPLNANKGICTIEALRPFVPVTMVPYLAVTWQATRRLCQVARARVGRKTPEVCSGSDVRRLVPLPVPLRMSSDLLCTGPRPPPPPPPPPPLVCVVRWLSRWCGGHEIASRQSPPQARCRPLLRNPEKGGRCIRNARGGPANQYIIYFIEALLQEVRETHNTGRRHVRFQD